MIPLRKNGDLLLEARWTSVELSKRNGTYLFLIKYRLYLPSVCPWYYGQFGIKGRKRSSELYGKTIHSELTTVNYRCCELSFVNLWKGKGVNMDIKVSFFTEEAYCSPWFTKTSFITDHPDMVYQKRYSLVLMSNGKDSHWMEADMLYI